MFRGVRGATTVQQNSASHVLLATEELLAEMIEQNGIRPVDVASVFISTTEDIDAAFPAKALRKFPGWTYVPVMCMQEMNVPDSLEMCIRIMIHINTTMDQQEIVHVYLKKATSLRPDLSSKKI